MEQKENIAALAAGQAKVDFMMMMIMKAMEYNDDNIMVLLMTMMIMMTMLTMMKMMTMIKMMIMTMTLMM